MKTSVIETGARKLMCVVASVAIAASMTVFAPALTQQASAADSSSVSVDTTGYVTAASYRAAEPTPEILGLSNVASNTAWSSLGALDWSAPYYYLFGTSEYNSNPNPYMVNTVYNYLTGTEDASPAMVYDNTRSGGPTASLNDYTTSQVVWDLLPDVILGNNKGYNYNSDDYAVAAATANDASDYKTYGYGDSDGTGDYGVVYDSTNIYTMLESMYNLAEAGNAAAAGTGKSLRYGDAVDIAVDFEEYVKGIQGYVLKAIANGTVEKKTVALIYNYDSETDTYQCIQTGVAEGTAASNRYLEAVQFVATNIADAKDVDDSGYATVTADEMAEVDLILVGSQSGSENLLDTESLVASLSTELQNKTYWMSSSNGSAGSCYGVVMNSVENAQNIGRIVGCLYDELLSQSDLIAYYYQNFYHINTDKLSDCIANAMDGVRNWNAAGSSSEATAWEESDTANYSEAAVQAIIDEGIVYIANNASELDSTAATYLALTSYISSDDISAKEASLSSLQLSNATVTLSKTSYTYNGTARKPGVTVTALDGTVLTKGTDYTVSYSNNKKAGTAKVTVTGTGTYQGSVTKTFTINKATQTLKVTKKSASVKYTKVKKKAQKLTAIKISGAKGTLTYKKTSGSKKITVNSKTGKVTVKKGTAKKTYKITVKVTAKKTTNYKAASKTVKVTVKVK